MLPVPIPSPAPDEEGSTSPSSPSLQLFEHDDAAPLLKVLEKFLPHSLPVVNTIREGDKLPIYASFPEGASPGGEIWAVAIYLELGDPSISSFCSEEGNQHITETELWTAGGFYSAFLQKMIEAKSSQGKLATAHSFPKASK